MKGAWKLIAVLACATLPGVASDVKVIANTSLNITQITADDLKGFFLLTKTSLPCCGHVEPVVLRSGNARETFAKQYLGKTAAALENYYRSLVFTGKGNMPKVLKSDADVVEYVSKTKGVIGYVSAEASTANVRILEVK